MSRLFNKPLSFTAPLVWSVFALAPAAHADGPAPDAKSLGITESALKFCGPIDSESAKKLKAKVDELTKGASVATLTQVRDSEDYRKARTMMDSFTSQVDERNAKTMCSNSATDK